MPEALPRTSGKTGTAIVSPPGDQTGGPTFEPAGAADALDDVVLRTGSMCVTCRRSVPSALMTQTSSPNPSEQMNASLAPSGLHEGPPMVTRSEPTVAAPLFPFGASRTVVPLET